jgi:glutamate-1-semialdehyde 2,1-aminomutase
LPGGCVTGRDDIVSMLEIRQDDEWNATRRVTHQGTYNANPVAAAAGITALRLIAKGGETERADASTASLVRGINGLFRELAVPGSAWAVSSMWHLNLGYDAQVPRDIEWDAVEEPRGVVEGLESPLKWALFNHGVDLMGTGGMLSSAHTEADIDRTVEAFRGAVGDLRAEGLLA